MSNFALNPDRVSSQKSDTGRPRSAPKHSAPKRTAHSHPDSHRLNLRCTSSLVLEIFCRAHLQVFLRRPPSLGPPPTRIHSRRIRLAPPVGSVHPVERKLWGVRVPSKITTILTRKPNAWLRPRPDQSSVRSQFPFPQCQTRCRGRDSCAQRAVPGSRSPHYQNLSS